MKSLLMAVAVALLLGAAEANAQWGSMGFPYAYGNGFTAGTVVPPANLQDRMPYFALYPPVYYSYPVPRPYGYSPFAYPGWTTTPHSEAMEPQTVVNPYLHYEELPPRPAPAPTIAPAKPTANRQASAGRTTTPQPMRMLNPYFSDAVAGSAP